MLKFLNNSFIRYEKKVYRKKEVVYKMKNEKYICKKRKCIVKVGCVFKVVCCKEDEAVMVYYNNKER
jgi:hypothetical protein